MDIIFTYLGLDWLSMILSIIAMIMLGSKLKSGFILFASANIIMIFVGYFMMQSLAIAIGNMVFMITNIRGFLKWTTNKTSIKEVAE